MQKKGANRSFEKELYGLSLTDRGFTYAAASVLLGKKAPVEWKDKATRILYASERPYFKVTLNKN